MSNRLFHSLYGLALVLGPTTALAAEVPGTEAPDLFYAGLKMVGALVAIIGTLVLVLHLARRFGSIRNKRFGKQEIIRILATKALTPRNYLAVVQVGSSVLTLGVTTESITCLDKVAAEAFQTESTASSRAAANDFARHLAAAESNAPPEEDQA